MRTLGVTVTHADHDWLDVTPANLSKATALEAIRLRHLIPPGRTIAVGDGPNDLDMLRWAAYSVAMGHAPAVVQAAADHVTGTIAERGAETVLLSLALAPAATPGCSLRSVLT
ncbi:HAD family hydrolase [Antribacter gilvus]|uniref:HAD family hydrolase n=1 Tax=Antribacter gilvus TaxID=2304675 RepID=UPI000F776E9E|nr:HAD hydrolase family protein [Antribacter gilvus]